MKSYTDLRQSKKLAEFLPLESADMAYIKHSSSDNPTWEFNEDVPPMILGNVLINELTVEGLPCWSLTALLNYLREIDFFPNIEADEFSVVMNINYYNEEEARPLAPVHNIKVENESFIDACYEMIIRLNEEKLI